MIKILKASAGSGKTWNLAKQYLIMMLAKHDPYSYRHILAVTFTNKATDEMKDRILKELHKLSADPESSGYYSDLVPTHYPDAASLAEASKLLLSNILHDYSAFAVSTIDRFFQQTLKAFAREIGQFSSYSIELDRGSLIKESVDRMLDSLTETDRHSRSLEWMTSKTMSQLEGGEGYKLDATLKKIADRFNSEEFKVALERTGADKGELYSDVRLSSLDERCTEIAEGYVRMLSDAARNVRRAFSDAGLDPFDTSRHFISEALDRYESLSPFDQVKLPTDSFRKNVADVSKWYTKANKHLEALVTSDIIASLDVFMSLFDVELKVYNTAWQLKSQIYGFAVANDLYDNFMEILKEKNVMTIDQTNNILKDIIDKSDTPFVYEKLGVRYDHFLLDEFQDTSKVQWENFKPLIDNSVAGGNDNLIVGDVKQSIYRWRQSEWELLENQVAEDFPGRTDISSLDTNFRSVSDIVDFNNEYFTAAAEYLDVRYGSDTVRSIYSDVRQKVNKSGRGMVEVSFCDEDKVYGEILNSVRKAAEMGYRLGEITILVRLNKEGGEIAEYLIANGIPVLSDDSLKIASSLTVRRLISLLSGIDNPQDSISRFLASSLGIEVPSSWHSLIDLCEELLRKLAESDPDTFNAEVLYIQSFMDLLSEYITSSGNSLRGFLKKWTEDKSNISSPKSEDSVRIMTVHKAKGLDFPYVIFPSLPSVEFFSFTNRWAAPDVKGTSLENVADGVYDVCLSGKSVDTLFSERYREEMQMQYIDNINILYVALTRASQAMSIISAMPSGVSLTDNGYEGDDSKFTDFSQWTMAFMASKGQELGFEKSESDGTVSFVKGEMPLPVHDESSPSIPVRTGFSSWPLNNTDADASEEVAERGRLKFSSEAMDFFAEDGSTGISASERIRGVVLHDIMSKVAVPSDLPYAVRQCFLKGDISESEAENALVFLQERIAEVSDRRWFPTDGRSDVMNETEMIDSDGNIYRPDRVVITDGKVIVVDYKFGEPDPRYRRQLMRYADIWRRMGYDDVSSFIWYLQTGEVVEV